MKLLDDQSLDELTPDAATLQQKLLEASGAGEKNLRLVTDDGSYIAVVLGADTEIQMIAGSSSLAAPILCVTKPLTIDRVIEAFQLFLAEDPRWREVVDWSAGETEAAVQAAHDHSRRAWKWIGKQYVRALFLIPVIALVATGGDIPKSFAIGWLPVTFGAFVKIIFTCYGKGMPAAREHVGKALGVNLYYGAATGMYQEFSGWKIDGEAPAWKHLAVLASMIFVMIGLTVTVLVGVGLVGSVGTWGFEALKAAGL